MKRALVALLLVAGCGESAPAQRHTAFNLPSLTRATAAGQPVGGLDCRPGTGAASWVHVELFERGRIVLLPAGIGIAPPRRVAGAYVRGGRCRYPLWTDEPTGLVAVRRPGLRLADLFRVWGRPLASAAVVHVDGRRRAGPPGAVALFDHAQIVIQVGRPLVAPHVRYRFPPGR